MKKFAIVVVGGIKSFVRFILFYFYFFRSFFLLAGCCFL